MKKRTYASEADQLYHKAFTLFYGLEGRHRDVAHAALHIQSLYERGVRPCAPELCYYLGCALYDGVMEIPDGRAQSAAWFYRALTGGERRGKTALCLLADEGEQGAQYMYAAWLMKRDIGSRRAGRYLKSAAGRGHAPAQYLLSLCCGSGACGVKKSAESAFEWAYKAFDGGEWEAAFDLGCYCAEGLGTQQDMERARMYWQIAAGHGHEDAAARLARMAQPSAHADAQPGVQGAYATAGDVQRIVEEGVRRILDADRSSTDSILAATAGEGEATRRQMGEAVQRMAGQLNDRFAAMERGISDIDRELKSLRGVCAKLEDGLKRVLDDNVGMYQRISALEEQLAQMRARQDADTDLMERIRDAQAQLEHSIGGILDDMQRRLESALSDMPEGVKRAHEDDLRAAFGGDVWRNAARLSDATCNALVSARVLLHYGMRSGLDDYRGVVISATSALENELCRRFFAGYMRYARETGGAVPAGMQTKTRFTMGDFYYIIRRDDKSPAECDTLDDYMRRHVLSDAALDALNRLGSAYAGDVFTKQLEPHGEKFSVRCHVIKVNYRDRAAHRDPISRDSAIMCCNELGIGDAQGTIRDVEGVLMELMRLTKPFDYA